MGGSGAGSDEGPILVPFGPTGPVPEGHQHCNSCINGFKRDGGGNKIPCNICKGKSFWNAVDIREHHERNPRFCKMTCGDTHRDPHFGPLPDLGDRDPVAEADALLARLEPALGNESAGPSIEWDGVDIEGFLVKARAVLEELEASPDDDEQA